MLHIVQAGWLLDDPAGGAQGAVSEIVTAMSAMDELDAFPQAGKHHRVLTYNIAPEASALRFLCQNALR